MSVYIAGSNLKKNTRYRNVELVTIPLVSKKDSAEKEARSECQINHQPIMYMTKESLHYYTFTNNIGTYLIIW